MEYELGPVGALAFILAAILLARTAALIPVARSAGVGPVNLAASVVLGDGVRYACVGLVAFIATPVIFDRVADERLAFGAIALAVSAGYWLGRGFAALIEHAPGLSFIRLTRRLIDEESMRRRGYVRANDAAAI